MNDRIPASTIITAHGNADFDCLSSMVAARKLYPDAALVFPGSQEQGLRDFFIQSATYLYNFYSVKEIDPESVRTVVACDTRQRSRLEHIANILDRDGVHIHTFDHHPDSDDDIRADFQDVRPWGSTVSILIAYLRERETEVSQDEATLMGLGLYEDTGCFTFTSTTEHDLLAAWWLKTRGMDVGFISDFLHRELNADQVSILNELLDNAERMVINGVEVCITQVSSDRYVRDLALLVHKMMEIENIKVVFALARMQDRIHLVARSRLPEVDTGKLCSSLGGGGHSYAASATVKDKTLAQVRDELFGLLYSHINPQIKVDQLMSSPAITIDQSERIADAATLMSRYGLKAIPVVEPGTRKCVGLLEHQLASRAQTHGLGQIEVQEYMLRSFSQIEPSDSLYQVMEIIIGQGQRLVPVVRGNAVIGVITRTDLIHYLVEEPARIPESLRPERKQAKNVHSLMAGRLPEEVYQLLIRAGELAADKGYRVYAIGGFVRDILLHRPNLDIDLVVEGDGIDYARYLVEHLGGRIRPHKKFGTAVVVLPDGQRVDVATARLEYYEHPAALPTVELSSIKMDLFRRDFSINSLAIQLNPERLGRLVDFFGGEKDIKEGVIRVLHSLSFVEDPTRILRAMRFEQRFSFRIGAQTQRLIKNAMHLDMFNKLSGSRLFQEFRLMLEEEAPLVCLKRMEEFDLLQSLHPLLKLDQSRERILEHTGKVLNWYRLLYIEPKPEVWKVYMLGLCTGYNNDQVRMLARRFSFPEKRERSFIKLRQDIHQTRERLYLWNKGDRSMSRLYFILSTLPLEGTLYLMAASKSEEIRKSISLYLSQLKDTRIEINGKDLQAIGLTPGPAYGRILTQVLSAKLDGRARDRQSQLELASWLAEREAVRSPSSSAEP
jgi:tRNA nucleotidyltransferase (CCA-adding enzyme)